MQTETQAHTHTRHNNCTTHLHRGLIRCASISVNFFIAALNTYERGTSKRTRRHKNIHTLTIIDWTRNRSREYSRQLTMMMTKRHLNKCNEAGSTDQRQQQQTQLLLLQQRQQHQHQQQQQPKHSRRVAPHPNLSKLHEINDQSSPDRDTTSTGDCCIDHESHLDEHTSSDKECSAGGGHDTLTERRVNTARPGNVEEKGTAGGAQSAQLGELNVDASPTPSSPPLAAQLALSSSSSLATATTVTPPREPDSLAKGVNSACKVGRQQSARLVLVGNAAVVVGADIQHRHPLPPPVPTSPSPPQQQQDLVNPAAAAAATSNLLRPPSSSSAGHSTELQHSTNRAITVSSISSEEGGGGLGSTESEALLLSSRGDPRRSIIANSRQVRAEDIESGGLLGTSRPAAADEYSRRRRQRRNK